MLDFLLYLIENRTISHPIMQWPFFKAIVLILAPITSVFLVIKFCSERKKIKYKGIINELCFFCAIYFLANLVAGGDMRRCVGLIYPAISLQIIYIYVVHCNRIRVFAFQVSMLFLLMNCINFILMFLNPGDWKHFFLGGENGVGYPLLLGLMYNVLYFNLTGIKTLLLPFVVLQVATIFMIFSGSNVVGLVLVLLLLSPLAYKLHEWLSLNQLTLIYFIVLFVIIVFGIEMMLDSSSFSDILEKTLGKDATMSGRTDIWILVLSEIYDSPIWGHGVLLDGSVFELPAKWEPSGFKMDSAHNQILQTTYESGLITIFAIYLMVRRLSIILEKTNKMRCKIIFKSFCLGVLVMYLAEAPNLFPLFEVVLLGSVIGQLEESVSLARA